MCESGQSYNITIIHSATLGQILLFTVRTRREESRVWGSVVQPSSNCAVDQLITQHWRHWPGWVFVWWNCQTLLQLSWFISLTHPVNTRSEDVVVSSTASNCDATTPACDHQPLNNIVVIEKLKNQVQSFLFFLTFSSCWHWSEDVGAGGYSWTWTHQRTNRVSPG